MRVDHGPFIESWHTPACGNRPEWNGDPLWNESVPLARLPTTSSTWRTHHRKEHCHVYRPRHRPPHHRALLSVQGCMRPQGLTPQIRRGFENHWYIRRTSSLCRRRRFALRRQQARQRDRRAGGGCDPHDRRDRRGVGLSPVLEQLLALRPAPLRGGPGAGRALMLNPPSPNSARSRALRPVNHEFGDGAEHS